MFNFSKVNDALAGKALVDSTVVTMMENTQSQEVGSALARLGASDKIIRAFKYLISKAGIIEDSTGNTVVVNAIAFFNGAVKGVGALVNDPEFVIRELDLQDSSSILTGYVIGGIMRRNRDIDAYNKSRQFHTDDIVCIVPINNHGWDEYRSAEQFIMNMVNCTDTKDAFTPTIPDTSEV